MTSLTRTTTAFVAAAGLLTLDSGALAQTATQADFDACNRTAQAGRAGSSGPTGSSSIGGGPGAAAGSDVNRHINSSGRLSSSAGSPGTNSGTVGSSHAAGAPSASPRTSATDPQLTGMAAAGHSDAAFQAAYRACMKQRGF